MASRLSTESSNNWLRFVDRCKVTNEDLKVKLDRFSAPGGEVTIPLPDTTVRTKDIRWVAAPGSSNMGTLILHYAAYSVCR